MTVRHRRIAVWLWALACTLVWFNQEKLLFRPVARGDDAMLSVEPDVHASYVRVPGARLSLLRYASRRVVLYGWSLGSSLAVPLAARMQPDATVLVSAYASMRELARQHYPWVPSALLRYPLRSDDVVANLRHSLLLIHGENDGRVPISHSERLAMLAPTARLVRFDDAANADVHTFPAYLHTLDALLTGLSRGGTGFAAR